MALKDVLLDKISIANQHPFLFIGSGFSKRYLNTENWENLLRKFSTEMDGDEFRYNRYSVISSESDYYGKLPQIATMLEKDFSLAVLSDENFKSFRNLHEEELKKGVSPLKIAIAEYLNTVLSNNPLISDEINLLRKLAVRNVSGIITTNYDQLIETIFNDYNVFIGQEELIFSDIFQIGEIYKIHGCITKPDSIVLTSEDYKKFQKTSAYLIAKILTIFLEYPIIFIGYGIQDKNILDILESISNCLSQDKLNILKDRFIFIEYSENEESISTYSKSFLSGNIITMTKITTNDFASVYSAILENRAKYNPKILRKLRHDIYKLAKSNDTNGTNIIATGFENLDNIDEVKNFVLGIGIASLGYRRIKSEVIYEDIVLDNKYFDPNNIITETLPELFPSNSSGLPVFKYLKAYNRDVYGATKDYILKHDCMDSFLNSTLKKRKESFSQSYTVDNIVKSNEFKKPYEVICLLEKENIDISSLEIYLVDLLKNNVGILRCNAELKRLIRIFDWLKYKNTP